MKKFIGIGLVAMVVLALTLSAGTAQAKAYLFKYSNSQSDTHPRSVSMYFFKDLVESASGGRIKVELYTSGVLGKEAEVLDHHFAESGLFGNIVIQVNQRIVYRIEMREDVRNKGHEIAA